MKLHTLRARLDGIEAGGKLCSRATGSGIGALLEAIIAGTALARSPKEIADDERWARQNRAEDERALGFLAQIGGLVYA
jgi:hypothetical protein